MLTIFALPKPFEGEFALIQRNAIQSWLRLASEIEIILFGNELGVKEIAEEFNLKHIPDVALNEFGTPLVNDIFEKAQKIAKYNILCYINADIILMSDFIKAFNLIKNEKEFLIVGQRLDFDLNREINFDNPRWEEELKKEALEKGKLHPPTGIDYFVFPKGFFQNILPFALGRTVWDEWLLYYAWKKKAKIIDATNLVMAIHQNHSYSHHPGGKKGVWEGAEAKRNLKLAGGYGHCLTIEDATHILTEKGLIPTPKMSIIRRLELVPYIGFFIRQRRKIMKLLK